MTQNATVAAAVKLRDVAPEELKDIKETEAYRSGWHDGRFGNAATFTSNQTLAGWSNLDRLAYYQGHRDGQRIKGMLS